MTVTKRKAYYLSGFDDRGAGHYRSVYLAHGEKQSAHAPYTLHAEAIDDDTWHTRLTDSAGTTTTEFHFIPWQHVMRPTMQANPVSLWWQTLKALAWYIGNGFLQRTHRHAPLFSLTILLAMCWTILAPVMATGWLVAVASGWIGPVIATLTGISGAFLLWWLYRYFYPLWITRAFVFNRQAAEHPETLLAELQQHAQRIADDIEQADADEYLLISHCYGTTLMPILLAELAPVIQASNKTVSVLYLAQTAPMLHWTCDWYPALVKTVPDHAIESVDYSSPADGLCYPQLASFASESGTANRACVLKSPRFHTLFDADHYARIVRRNKFRIHFQYLLSSHITTGYDYFYMTAGPMRLKDYALSR